MWCSGIKQRIIRVTVIKILNEYIYPILQGNWIEHRDAKIPFYVFISICNSLHVSSTSRSSSGETNYINTASGNSHSENR
jgi:hypothetical protein